MPVVKPLPTREKRPDISKIDKVVFQFEAFQENAQGLTLDIAEAIGEEIVNEMVAMITFDQVRPKSKYVPLIFTKARKGYKRGPKGWPLKKGKTLYETGQFKDSSGFAVTRFRRAPEKEGAPRQRSAYVVVGAAPEIYKHSRHQGPIDPNNPSKDTYVIAGRDERIPAFAGEGPKTNSKIMAIQELGARAHPRPRTQKGSSTESLKSLKGLFGPKRHPRRQLLKNALKRVGIKNIMTLRFWQDMKEIKRSGRIPIIHPEKKNPNRGIQIYTDEYSAIKLEKIAEGAKKNEIFVERDEIFPPGMRDFVGRFSRTAFKFDAVKFQKAAYHRTQQYPPIEVSWKRFTGKETNYVADFGFGIETPKGWEVSGGELTSYYPGLHISANLYQHFSGTKEFDKANRLGQAMLNRPIVDLLGLSREPLPSDPKKASELIKKHYVYSGPEKRFVRNRKGEIQYDDQGNPLTTNTKSQSIFLNTMRSQGVTQIEDRTGESVSLDEFNELIQTAEEIEKISEPFTKIHTDMVKLVSLSKDKTDLKVIMGFGYDLPAGVVYESDGKTKTIATFKDRIIVREDKLFIARPRKDGTYPEESIKVTDFLTQQLTTADPSAGIEGRSVEVMGYDPSNMNRLVEELEAKGYRFDLDRMWQEGLIPDPVLGAPPPPARAMQRKAKQESRKAKKAKPSEWTFPAGTTPTPLWWADMRTEFTPKYLLGLDLRYPHEERISKWGFEPGTKFNSIADLEFQLNSRLPNGGKTSGEGWVVTKLRFDPAQKSKAVKTPQGDFTHATFRYVADKSKFKEVTTIERPIETKRKRKVRKAHPSNLKNAPPFSTKRMVQIGLIDREPTQQEQEELLRHLEEMIEKGDVWFDRFDLLRVRGDSTWSIQRLKAYLRFYFGDKAAIDWKPGKDNFHTNFKFEVKKEGTFLVETPFVSKPTRKGEKPKWIDARISAIRIKPRDLMYKSNDRSRVEWRQVRDYKSASSSKEWQEWYGSNKEYFDAQVEAAIKAYKGKEAQFNSISNLLIGASKGNAKLMLNVVQMLKAVGIDISKINKASFIQIFINSVKQEI